MWPDLGGLDLGQELLALAAVVAVVLVLIPVLFFGLELIILGVLLAAGDIARTLLGQPWVVQVTSTDPLSPGRRLEWRVRGWRQIAELDTRRSRPSSPLDTSRPRSSPGADRPPGIIFVPGSRLLVRRQCGSEPETAAPEHYQKS